MRLGQWTGWAGRQSVNTATNNNTGLNATFQSDFSAINLDNELTYGLDYIHQTSSSTYGGVEYMSESTDSTGIFLENKVLLNRGLVYYNGSSLR